MNLIFQNEVGSSFYYSDQQLLVYRSNKLIINTKVNLIEELLKQTILILDKSIVSREIVDLSEMRGNFNKVMNYLLNNYYPEMQKKGLKKCACVVPDDIIAKNLVGALIDRNTVITQSFKEFQAAQDWILS